VRIAYVLPHPELNGGNKVVCQHAALLAAAGEEVTVLGLGPPPTWTALPGPYHDYSAAPPRLPSQDLVIATYWTTLGAARDLALGPLAHFCQGYEGALPHLRPQLAAIEEAYSRPVPALVVAPHLGELLRVRFGRESKLAPPPLDPLFRPALRLRPRRRPWVAVPGIFQSPVKDVPTALAAVRLLRTWGVRARLLRVATLPLSDEEGEMLAPDRYLCGVPPATVARALARCDLLLMPSRREEGFGLPLLEAMAAKVPAVASEIPSTLFFAAGAAALAPAGDAAAFAAAAHRLLTDPRAWRRARRRGRRAAQAFAPAAVAPQLLAAVRWARERALAAPAAAEVTAR
jgi:glycosyltransferase involved in cell wall biosynthesis